MKITERKSVTVSFSQKDIDKLLTDAAFEFAEGEGYSRGQLGDRIAVVYERDEPGGKVNVEVRFETK